MLYGVELRRGLGVLLCGFASAVRGLGSRFMVARTLFFLGVFALLPYQAASQERPVYIQVAGLKYRVVDSARHFVALFGAEQDYAPVGGRLVIPGDFIFRNEQYHVCQIDSLALQETRANVLVLPLTIQGISPDALTRREVYDTIYYPTHLPFRRGEFYKICRGTVRKIVFVGRSNGLFSGNDYVFTLSCKTLVYSFGARENGTKRIPNFIDSIEKGAFYGDIAFKIIHPNKKLVLEPESLLELKESDVSNIHLAYELYSSPKEYKMLLKAFTGSERYGRGRTMLSVKPSYADKLAPYLPKGIRPDEKFYTISRTCDVNLKITTGGKGSIRLRGRGRIDTVKEHRISTIFGILFKLEALPDSGQRLAYFIVNGDTITDSKIVVPTFDTSTLVQAEFIEDKGLSNGVDYRTSSDGRTLTYLRVEGSFVDLRKVQLPKSITQIGGQALKTERPIRHLILPESVRALNAQPFFYGGGGLELLAFPSEFSSLSVGSLAGLPRLRELVFLGNTTVDAAMLKRAFGADSSQIRKLTISSPASDSLAVHTIARTLGAGYRSFDSVSTIANLNPEVATIRVEDSSAKKIYMLVHQDSVLRIPLFTQITISVIPALPYDITDLQLNDRSVDTARLSTVALGNYKLRAQGKKSYYGFVTDVNLGGAVQAFDSNNQPISLDSRVLRGDTVRVAATVAEGYRMVRFLVNSKPSPPDTTIVVRSPITLALQCERKRVPLVVNPNPSIQVELFNQLGYRLKPKDSVALADTVVVKFSAEDGYEVTKVFCNAHPLDLSESPLKIPVEGPISISFRVEIQKCIVSLLPSCEGHLQLSDQQGNEIHHGDTCLYGTTLVAAVNLERFEDNPRLVVNGVKKDLKNGLAKVTIAGSVAIGVLIDTVWHAISVQLYSKVYSVELSGRNLAQISEGYYKIPHSEIIKVKVQPRAGYIVSAISLNGKKKSDITELSLPVREDINIIPVFQSAQCKVTYPKLLKGGSLEVYDGDELVLPGSSVPKGDELSVVPIPEAGNRVVSLLLNRKPIPPNAYSAVIDEDWDINCTFQAQPCTQVGDMCIDESSGTIVSSVFQKDSLVLDDPHFIRIGAKAFANLKKLKYVVIAGGVRDIDANAFAGCTKLEIVTFSPDVRNIGPGVFSRAKKLEMFRMQGKNASDITISPNAVETDALVEKQFTIQCPAGSAQGYASHTFFSKFPIVEDRVEFAIKSELEGYRVRVSYKKPGSKRSKVYDVSTPYTLSAEGGSAIRIDTIPGLQASRVQLMDSSSQAMLSIPYAFRIDHQTSFLLQKAPNQPEIPQGIKIEKGGISLVSNIVDNELRVANSTGEVQGLSIYSVTGRLLRRFTVSPGENTYALSSLEAGFYILSSNREGHFYTTTFVKR